MGPQHVSAFCLNLSKRGPVAHIKKIFGMMHWYLVLYQHGYLYVLARLISWYLAVLYSFITSSIPIPIIANNQRSYNSATSYSYAAFCVDHKQWAICNRRLHHLKRRAWIWSTESPQVWMGGSPSLLLSRTDWGRIRWVLWAPAITIYIYIYIYIYIHIHTYIYIHRIVEVLTPHHWSSQIAFCDYPENQGVTSPIPHLSLYIYIYVYA